MVTDSIIKTKQKEVIREIHFRLIEQEQNFTELNEQLTRECSENPWAEVSEGLNSVELGTLPYAISQQLSGMKANTISAPILLGSYYAIFRLEQYVSATCDRSMEKRLINELFDQWMQQQLTYQKYHLENLNSLK